jgi:sugar phosphate isomerase/epimerase
MQSVMTRRTFAGLVGGAVASAVGPRSAWAEGARLTYGVQMYELREMAKTDLPRVFRTIRDAGFEQVELYPIAYRVAARELRAMVKDAGLGCVSGHFDYEGLEQKVSYAKELGLGYMVCPMLPKPQQTDVAGFRAAAEFFNKVGKLAQQQGMQFAFHNHCYEFAPMGGTTGFATLMQHTKPELVKLEVDCYWLTQAGQDPITFLKAHADRAVLLHMKDRAAGAPTGYDMDAGGKNMAELGKGAIHWPEILAEGRSLGIQYAFVDQDFTAMPIPESLKGARAYLQGIRY